MIFQNMMHLPNNNLDILARIVSTAVEGCPPEVMGLGPIGASNKALKRVEMTGEQIVNQLEGIYKNQIFRDKTIYQKQLYGNRFFTDYYHREFGIEQI